MAAPLTAEEIQRRADEAKAKAAERERVKELREKAEEAAREMAVCRTIASAAENGYRANPGDQTGHDVLRDELLSVARTTLAWIVADTAAKLAAPPRKARAPKADAQPV